ncbi:MAG TPA: hypothetical protein HA360_03050 [Nanoarchaeota archaeon]|nr:hypothetical protein [Nanoarchaeota archaeon]HII14029.1 hypothetical protein [Nanoarchaeota archaeon]
MKQKRGNRVDLSSKVLKVPVYSGKKSSGKLFVYPKKSLSRNIPFILERKESFFERLFSPFQKSSYTFADTAKSLYFIPTHAESLFPKIHFTLFNKKEALRLEHKKVLEQKKAPLQEIRFPELEKKISPIKNLFPELRFLKKPKPAVFPSLPFPELVMQKKTIFKKQATPEVVSSPLQEKETFPDPLEKTRELIQKCRKSLDKGNLDYAEIFYGQLRPFYLRISSSQRSELYPVFIALQHDLEMLRLSFVKQDLQKYLPLSYTPQKMNPILHVPETLSQVLPLTFPQKKNTAFENLSNLDPFEHCIELVQKSQKALEKGNLDYALIYSEELKVFYTQLSREQKERIGSSVLEVQQALEMLQLAIVRKRLQKS